MVVVVLSSVPARVRGDLSKWMLEVSTGVYVGNLNAAVRKELWERTVGAISEEKASAIMVWSTNTEQGYDFMAYGNTWRQVDFDGLKLMRRGGEKEPEGVERAVRKRMFSVSGGKRKRILRECPTDYVVLDVETTGMNMSDDHVIEIGCVLVRNRKVADTWSCLVDGVNGVPPDIMALTGVTGKMLDGDGISAKEAAEELAKFIGKFMIIGYHVDFDMQFLRKLHEEAGICFPRWKAIDIMKLARQICKGLPDYKLDTVVDELGIDAREVKVLGQRHRALYDAYLEYLVYERLLDILLEQ